MQGLGFPKNGGGGREGGVPFWGPYKGGGGVGTILGSL